MTYEIPTETYIYPRRPNAPVNWDKYTKIFEDLKAHLINEDMQAQFICYETPPVVWCFVPYEIPTEIYIFPLRSNTPANTDTYPKKSRI